MMGKDPKAEKKKKKKRKRKEMTLQ